ncbi:hypothetical protein OROMI_007879 [Orobanche minor]
MGMICESKGNYENALEHLVLASMAMVANGRESEVAPIDCSIGDAYLYLNRYDEVIFAYQKALTSLKSTKGSYRENALRIYEKPAPGIAPEEIASGLTDISAIYESMDEVEKALGLLQKVLKIYDDGPGQQNTIAGIEAQMGVIYYMLGKYLESCASFGRSIAKLRAGGEKKLAFSGLL